MKAGKVRYIKKGIIGILLGAVAYALILFLLLCQRATTVTQEKDPLLIADWGVQLEDSDDLLQYFSPQTEFIASISFAPYGFDENTNGSLEVCLQKESEIIASKKYAMNTLASGEEKVFNVYKKVDKGEYLLHITYSGSDSVYIACGNLSDNYAEIHQLVVDNTSCYDKYDNQKNLIMGISYSEMPGTSTYVKYLIYVLLFVICYILFSPTIRMRRSKEIILSIKHHLLSGILAATLSMLSFAIFLSMQFYLCDFIHFNYNLFSYVITILVFAVSYLLSLNIFKHFRIEVLMEDMGIRWKIFCYSGLILLIWLITRMVLNSFWLKATNNPEAWIPTWTYRPVLMSVMVLLFGIIGVLLFSFFGKKNCKPIIIYGYYFVLALLCAFCAYAPNYPVTDIHHTNAYFASVYSVYQHQPFDIVSTSTYGRYGLLLYLPFKLLGGTYVSFNLLMALIVIIQIMCLAYVFRYFVKNAYLQIISITVIAIMYTWRTVQYWQNAPHRILFLTFYLVVIVKWLQSSYRKKYEYIGYLLGIFAIIWNLETGLFCLGSWCFLMVYKKVTEEKWYSKKVILCVIKNAALIIIDFLVAYGIIEGYNYLCSRKFYGLSSLMFPFISNEGAISVDGLMDSFPIGNEPYLYAMLLLAFGLIIIITRCRLRGQKRQIDDGIFMISFLSVNGLLSFVYYINNPYPNSVTIVIIQCVLIMSILISRCKWNRDVITYRSIAYKVFSKGLLYSLNALAVLSIFSLIHSVKYQITNHSYRTTEFDELCETIEPYLTEDTIAFGEGIPALYCNMGRKTNCPEVYTLNSTTIPKIQERIDEADRIIITKPQLLKISLNFDDFDEIVECQYKELHYFVLQRRDTKK